MKDNYLINDNDSVRGQRRRNLGVGKSFFLALGFIASLSIGGAKLYEGIATNRARQDYFASLPIEKVKATDACAYDMWKRVAGDISDPTFKPTSEEFYRDVCTMNNISRQDLENRFPIKDKYTLPDYDGKPN